MGFSDFHRGSPLAMQGPQNMEIRYAFDGDAWRGKQDVLGEIF